MQELEALMCPMQIFKDEHHAARLLSKEANYGVDEALVFRFFGERGRIGDGSSDQTFKVRSDWLEDTGFGVGEHG